MLVGSVTQIPLTFLVSHFTAEWTERENFSVVV